MSLEEEVRKFLILSMDPLEAAYRIGYEDALRNYAIWKNGEQFVGAMEKPLNQVLVEFRNAKIPERY